jgi:hypothetical protein
MSESVIYCEGYHDRAFWKGWLMYLGCQDPGMPLPGSNVRRPVTDPWNLTVKRGHFAYHSRSGQFIRVEPCNGKSNILPAVRNRLQQRSTKALTRLVINIDSDVTAAGVPAGTSGTQRRHVEHFMRAFDPAATVNADGEIELDAGATKVSLVRWEVSDPPTAGLPDQQTLERLVCAGLAAAYPHRPAPVQNWLNARPMPPAADPKEHAWSYMAGWYAEHGCEAFYSNLWSDSHVAAALESRLRSSGAWQIGATLAG